MAFTKHTTAEKKEYAKKFPKRETEAYRRGKKAGFLEGVHAPKKK